MADADAAQSAADDVATGMISNQSSDGVATSVFSPKELQDFADRKRAAENVRSNRTGILFTKLQPPGAS